LNRSTTEKCIVDLRFDKSINLKGEFLMIDKTKL